MRIKLFSHTDLDGYGCNLLLRMLFTKEDVDCENCNYTNINEIVLNFFQSEEYKNYNKIFITDISVNEEVAEIIDNIVKKENINIILLDHHPTAIYLNKYSWVNVDIEKNEEKTSGTRMLYDYWEGMFSTKAYSKSILNIVENIRKYDTWLWKEKYNDIIPKQLNDLFHIFGANRFLDKIEHCIRICEAEDIIEIFIKDNKWLLDLQQEKIDKYIDSKNKSIIKRVVNNYKVGIVFAEQFISELGNKLSEINEDCDLIAIISDKTISYRTVKDNVDCGEFAKIFGGGGHLKSAGSQINLENKIGYIEKLFNIKINNFT